MDRDHRRSKCLHQSSLVYLVEAAGRLPRLDWRNALLGVFLSTVVQAILPGVACGREQPADERGWQAYLTVEEDEPVEAVVYCPDVRRESSATA